MSCLRAKLLRLLTARDPYQSLPFPISHTDPQQGKNSPHIGLHLYLFSLGYWGLVFLVLALLSAGPIAVNSAGWGAGESFTLGAVLRFPKQVASQRELASLQERLYYTRLALVVFDGVQVVLALLALALFAYLSARIVRKLRKANPAESHFSLHVLDLEESKYEKFHTHLSQKAFSIDKIGLISSILQPNFILKGDHSDPIVSNSRLQESSSPLSIPSTRIAVNITFSYKGDRSNCYRYLASQQIKAEFPGIIVQSAVEMEEILNFCRNWQFWPNLVLILTLLGAFGFEIIAIFLVLPDSVGNFFKISAFLVVFNWFLQKFVLKIAIWSHPFSLSMLKTSVFTQISLLRLASIGLAVLIQVLYISDMDLNRQIYSELSLFLFILLLFVPLPSLIQSIWLRIKPPLHSFLRQKYPNHRNQLKEWALNPDIDLPSKYSLAITAIYVGFGPAGGMPLLNSACAVIFLSLYAIERANAGLYSPPIEKSHSLHLRFAAFTAGAVCMHCIVSWGIFTNEDIFPETVSSSNAAFGKLQLTPNTRNWQEKASDYPQMIFLSLTLASLLAGVYVYKRLKTDYELGVSKPLWVPSIAPTPTHCLNLQTFGEDSGALSIPQHYQLPL